MACLRELPLQGTKGVQHFLRPPSRRRPSHASLRRSLLETDRDFTPEDYELLLELDTNRSDGRGSGGERSDGCIRATRFEVKALLERFPKVPLAKGFEGTECSICLSSMKAGVQVRTLPCMHIFHRRCIDRWIMASADRPRCPID